MIKKVIRSQPVDREQLPEWPIAPYISMQSIRKQLTCGWLCQQLVPDPSHSGTGWAQSRGHLEVEAELRNSFHVERRVQCSTWAGMSRHPPFMG